MEVPEHTIISSAGFARITCQDYLAFLASIDDESVDLVLTDPPYSSMEKHRAIGTTTRFKQSGGSSNEWFETIPNEAFEVLFQEFYRILKPKRHAYIMCDAETMFAIKPMGEAAGFKFWKPVIWSKLAMSTGWHYRGSHEYVLFFEKRSGKQGRQLHHKGMKDVLEHKRVHRGYPTEKPVPLGMDLVRQSTNPYLPTHHELDKRGIKARRAGLEEADVYVEYLKYLDEAGDHSKEVVVDPFMGSGAFGVSAMRLGRTFLGNDVNMKAFQLARTRLNKTSQDFEKYLCDERRWAQEKCKELEG